MLDRAKRDRRPAVVLRPDRVRTPHGTPFGWLAAGLHREGWLRELTVPETAAYTFLCLVANRQGVSWYRRDRISRELGLDDQETHGALARLEELDLVAYRPFRRGAVDGYRQVLTLPAGGPPAPRLPLEVLRLAEAKGLPPTVQP